jgi:pyrroloquinoline quinone biosynthesis protein B
MKVVLLGTAAGGGFPQWNCWCPTCRVAREAPERARPRTQSSLAVSADGQRWFLCNASPDVREQLARLTHDPSPAFRTMPVDGILLTDAELDHTLGLVLLRESRRLHVHCTNAVRRTLECDSALLAVTRAFAEVEVTELLLDTVLSLTAAGEPSGLTVEAFLVAGEPPRFASTDERGHTVGLLIRCDRGGAMAYLPGCAELDDGLLARLAGVPLVIVDGTFWRDDELVRLGLSHRSAKQMGHLPIGGDDGSLARLRALGSATTVVYAHVNNSNPVLVESSPERRAIEDAGHLVGEDGMQITVAPDGGVTMTRVP